MKGRAWDWVRDFAFEEQLRTNEDLAATTGEQVIEGDRLFTAQEKDLPDVLRLLREVAARRGGRRALRP